MKLLAGLLAIWSLFRFYTVFQFSTSDMGFLTPGPLIYALLGVDAAVGLLLLLGSIGIFFKRRFGVYLGLLGLLLLLLINAANIFLGPGDPLMILAGLSVGLYLFHNRGVYS